MLEKGIEIAFFQEAEIKNEYDTILLQINRYKLYLSENLPKSRIISYVKTSINHDVTTDKGIEAIKITTKKFEIVGIYQPYKLQNGMTYVDYSNKIISCIRETHKKEPNRCFCVEL